MKVILIVLLIFLATINTIAQISINSSDMPSAGDTLRYSVSDVTQDIISNYAKTGSTYIWDFSGLEPNSQDIYNYQNSVQTPYAFFFIGSYGLKITDSIGMGTYSIKNIYNFFKKSSSKFEANGMGLTFNGFPVPAYYIDNDEIYLLPLTYGKHDSTTFYFNTNLGGMLQLSMAGYRINTVDGEGKITTPFGTFDCIRVKTFINEIDSIGIGSFKVGFPRQRMEYKWLAKGVRIPVLEINGDVIAGNFTPTTVRYRDKYRNIISPFAPVASFDADKTSANVGETVTFTNNSSGIGNTYQWSVSPYTFYYTGSTDSTSESPQIIFTKSGSYTIKLRAVNNFGMDDSLRKNYVNISGSSSNYKPVADFIFDNDNPNTGTDVYFTDKSKLFAPTTYLWTCTPNTVTFKWGTNEGSKNPIIRFNKEGKYFIKLSVSNVYGQHDTTKSLTVAINSIEENNYKNFIVYPLPVNSNGMFVSSFFSVPSTVSVAIFSMEGKLIHENTQQNKFGMFDYHLDRAVFPACGIYFLKINTENSVFYKKIVVE